MAWSTFSGHPLQKPIIQLVEETIKREKEQGFNLKICIGTDSQVKSEYTRFATVIVFYRENSGGFMYVNHSSTDIKMSIRERMIQEVSKSIDIAYKICPILDKENIDLEVHADINTDPSFESNSALKEAMGYIKSMGYIFKAKPDAYASSACADKVV